MAEKKRFLDVWIIESNTVYREVPFTVVSDWVQQGRLLADDMLRPSGTAQWFRLGGMPAFAAYLPKAVPYRVEDQAEALEQVQVDFAWKRRPEDEDEDVDMIPLIDVSLVLLIFFIMISSVTAGALGGIKLPITEEGSKVDPNTIWVGIQLPAQAGGAPVYSLGEGAKRKDLVDGSQETTDRAVLLKSLDGLLRDKPDDTEVRIRADGDMTCDTVMDLMGEIQLFRPKVGRIQKDVAEPPR
jgi:biopolymer transport protein ExbD